MIEQTTRNVAAKCGWLMTSEYEQGSRLFCFHRKTPSGVPFCFSVEVNGNELANVIMEIISFVDELDPKRCAWEWLAKSGAVHPSRFHVAIADMDEIRKQAWLLACRLSETAGGAFPFLCLD